MKNKKSPSDKFVTGILMVLISCTFAQAQESSIISSLNKNYGQDRSMEMVFDLEIFWKVREKTEKKSGVIEIGPNDKFRVEMDKNSWVCDGQTYWQYSKATKQVVIKRLLDVDISLHPSQVIKTYLTEYKYTVENEDEKTAFLTWKCPEEETAGQNKPKELAAWVDKNSGTVKKLKIVDKSGNESTYTFKKTRLDVQIPAETFNFTIPEGATVLDTRD